jgi:ubiquitin carboxyl-terminal hydrolase 9/13
VSLIATSYANSVLQALYFCAPFRELLLQSLDLTTQEEIPAKPQQSLSAADAARRKPERRTSTTNPGPEQANGQPAPIPPSPASLSSALRSLYKHISCHPAEKGTVAPKAFIDKLKELHEEFRSNMQQDAQEFLIFLLNKIHEELKGMKGAGHSDDCTWFLM